MRASIAGNTKTYSPEVELNPAQMRAYRRVEDPEQKITAFVAGAGSGKTYFGGFVAAMLCIQNEGCSGILVAHDLDAVTEVVLPDFLRWIPEEMIISHNLTRKVIKLTGDRTVYYTTAGNKSKLEAKTLAWAYCDELRYWPPESWIRLFGRIRDAGASNMKIFVTTTPDRRSWIYHALTSNPDIVVIHGSAHENRRNLHPNYLPTMKRALTKELYEAYVEGKWVIMSGGVFKYREERHLISNLYDPSKPLHASMDFGRVNPHVVLFQYHEFDTLFRVRENVCVIAEFGPKQTPTRELCHLLKDWLEEKEFTIANLYCDPAGNAKSQEEGISSVEIVREVLGVEPIFTYDKRRTNRRNGVELMQSKLSPYEGPPSLYFDRSLSQPEDDPFMVERGIVRGIGVVEAIEQIEYDGDTGVYEKKTGRDHSLDALRYAIINLIEPPASSYGSI